MASQRSIISVLLVTLVLSGCAALVMWNFHYHNDDTRHYYKKGTDFVLGNSEPSLLSGSMLAYGNADYGSVGFAQYDYYYFTVVSTGAQRSTISVTNLPSTSIVYVYVQYNTDATIHNFNWTAQSATEGEDVTLELDNLINGGYYSVAVYGFDAASSFMISLDAGGGSSGYVTGLDNGVEYDGTLYNQDPQYYDFNSTNLVNFQLNANSVNGNGHAHTYIGLGYQPDESHYDYASTDVNSGDACIYVEYPTDGHYFVTIIEYVGGETMPYTIELDQNTNDPQCSASVVTYPTLVNDVMTNGTLTDLNPNYYTFSAQNYANFQVNANSINGGGHAHVYISLNQLPTTTNYDYASSDVGTGDACIFVTTPADGTYYVEVIELSGGETTPYTIEFEANEQNPLCSASSSIRDHHDYSIDTAVIEEVKEEKKEEKKNNKKGGKKGRKTGKKAGKRIH